MRRKEKEITDKSEIEAVIHESIVCRIALSEDNMPYMVPLCFGYKDDTLYVHGALKGRKIDILKKNPNLCFEFDSSTEVVEGENGCKWSMKYRSVIGFGKACFLEDPGDKQKALDIIMAQYSDKPFLFPEKSLKGTAVIKIKIQRMTGKQSGLFTEM